MEAVIVQQTPTECGMDSVGHAHQELLILNKAKSALQYVPTEPFGTIIKKNVYALQTSLM